MRKVYGTSPKNSGFGFVDVLLTVTIVAILTAVPVLMFDTSGHRLDTAARQLVADLLEAQHLAVKTRKPFGVRFSPGSNRYEFVLESGDSVQDAEASLRLDVDVSDAEVDQLLEAKASGDPSLPHGTLINLALGGGGSDVIFDIDGAPRVGGSVDIDVLGSRLRIRIQTGAGRIVITKP